MLYAFRWEPYWLTIERTVLAFDGKGAVPSGLRIVQLSDIHRSAIVPDSYIRECVSKVNELDPDLVFITGDCITGGEEWVDGLGELLSPLDAKLGVWASMGNHDGGEWAKVRGGPRDSGRVRGELEGAGIGVLENESVLLEHGGVPVRVVGMGDLWAGYFEPGEAFRGAREDEFVICLSHNPDTIGSLGGYPVDLLLSGHTHGGQVSIPFVGAPLLPVENTEYARGLHRIAGGYAYVNRGVGLLRKVRFNCRPEIAFFVVR